MLLTPGQRSDLTQGAALLAGYAPGAVVADRGYDADDILRRIREAGAEAVIPPKSSRIEARTYDEALYRERNEVERFFGRLKLNRRIATRYEKTARNYLAMLHLVGAMVWLL